MERKEVLAGLAKLIAVARTREEAPLGSDPSRAHVQAVVRSLRATYLSLAAGLPLTAVAQEGFLLDVSARGTFRLLQAGATVPVHTAYLQFLFRAAGVVLPSGQTYLLDPELAQEAIEDSLWSVGLRLAIEERKRVHLARTVSDRSRASLVDATLARLAEMKLHLVGASLVATTLLERRAGRPEPGTEVA